MATTRHSLLHLSSASSASASASASTAALHTRIAHKRAELAHLQQLRDLSGQMAEQMRLLEQKLATLSDGTEAVACVLANWENVMRAISMAASGAASGLGAKGGAGGGETTTQTEAEAEADREGKSSREEGKEGEGLPVTLVRIPAGIREREDEVKGDRAGEEERGG